MARHRRQQEETGEPSSHWQEDEDQDYFGQNHHPRRASDNTHDRGRPRRHNYSDTDSDSEVESLPDRFDDEGRPLDRHDGYTGKGKGKWTNRSGQFERKAQTPGDFSVRGAWHVGGTDGESVERIAKSVTGALDGTQSWMGVIGEVLGGAAGNQAGGRRIEDDDDDERPHKDRPRQR